MACISPMIFFSLLWIQAPYGRHSTRQGWGVLVSAPVAWMVMESPNLWVTALVYWNYGRDMTSLANKLLLSCFVVHYINRSIVYPLRMSSSQSAPMPLAVCSLAFLFCCWNSLLQSLALVAGPMRPADYLLQPNFALGISLFITGALINIRADETLRSLRALKKGHMVPYGGLFELVSCPNYAGEILEWTGFAIACWSFSSLAFALFTFANIGPRAHGHHLWYRDKFDKYPLHRRAVIPFIW